MEAFYRLFIILGLLAIQLFLSSRNNKYLGAILPVLLVVFLIWSYMTDRIDSLLKVLLFLLVGMVAFLLEWDRGREYVKNKQKKELEKMKMYDTK